LRREAAALEFRRTEDIAPIIDTLKGRAEAIISLVTRLYTPTGFASVP
jgi:hypothetical protein